MNLCKDCKHCEIQASWTICEFGGYEDYTKRKYWCKVENRIDPVTGKDVYTLCSEARDANGFCGLSGLHFEEEPEEVKVEEPSKPWWNVFARFF